MANQQHLMSEGDIPENWVPIDTPTVVPGTAPMGAPAPPVPHDMPQYFSGSLAPQLQHDDTFVSTQMASPRIPKNALMPFGIQASALTNAGVQSTAKIIAQQAIAAIPAAAGGPDTDIVAGVNRQVFGSFDTSYQTTMVSVPGTITSISTSGVASSLNTVAIAVADGNSSAAGSPGAGWTSLGGGGEFFKIIQQGPISITQTFGVGQNTACQVLCLFRGNGTTPTFTNRGSGTGGSSPHTVNFTPTAGNSLLFINVGGGQFNNNVVITDSQNNNWQTLQNAFAIDGPVGSSPANQINIAYAQNISGSNTTVTITFNSNNSLGTWIIYEVTNLLNVSSGIYTFQTTDNDLMVLFTGGANIAATLPSPALPAGWQALVINDSGVGVDTLIPQSGALLNNLTGNQTLQPGYFTWVFSDGTNYWLTSKVQPQAITKLTHQWLDSYSGQTGLFTQSQPSFSDISGNIPTSEMNGGSGASATTFFRGDPSNGSWSTLSINTTSQKSESGADTNVLQFFPPSVAGSYRIRFVMSVSAANAATLGWTATYKNSNGVTQTPTNLALYQVGVATPALTFTTSSAGDYHGFVDVDIDNSGTNIIVKLTFTGTSFSAKVTATIERLV